MHRPTFQKNHACRFIIQKTLSLVILLLPLTLLAQPIAQPQLEALEKTFDGKIGVYAINTGNDQTIAYHAEERFPFQSTFKVMAVAALLKQSEINPSLLAEKIHYTNEDVIPWHPITGKYVNTGMTLKALANATIRFSDNPAVNLIMKKLGGPQVINHFAHSIGNSSFMLKHYENHLNSDPQKNEDTVTPKDMAISLKKLMLGAALAPPQRKLLVTWMKNNTTGNQRIRAGVPIGWTVADKTGSGNYGVANDIGIIWSPLCKPIVLVIYTVQNNPTAKPKDDMIASTTRIILREFAQQDTCFKALSN